MNDIKIVNLKFYKGDHEYCGRPSILGNPFSHKDGTLAKYKVNSVDEAISYYDQYLKDEIANNNHKILNELVRLRLIYQDRLLILGCWCVPFHECHCNIIKREILNLTDNQVDKYKSLINNDNDDIVQSIF